MENKIEKFDKHKEYRFEAELTTDIMAKIEEIIDHLNSQSQPEERMIPVKDGGIDIKKLKELASDNYGKDTPEEWEEVNKDIWYMVGGKKYVSINGEKYVRTSDLEQLLKEREREVLERLLEKRSRLPFTENWLVWVTHITRELNKLDGKKQ